MKRAIPPLLCLLGLMVAPLAHADCDGPITPVSAKEKAFYSAQFPAMRAAIPKPPAGWQYKDDSKAELAPGYKDYMPTQNCGPSNYYMDLGIEYERPMTQADSDAETQAMQAAPDPAKQKKLDALMTQEQALMQKFGEAAQKQDSKAMEALGKQNDALTAQMTALQQDMNSGSQAKIAAIQWDRSAKINISFNNNSGGATCYGNPKPLQVPGAAMAYACEAPADYSSPGEQLDPAVGRIVVIFGKATAQQYDWNRKDAQGKEVKDKYMDIKFDGNDDHAMVVKNVVVDITGDDLARAQSLYKQINFAPLATLIKK
ncbi:MAG: hypothetical protein ACM3ZT_09980 [Bacillota bacterium]